MEYTPRLGLKKPEGNDVIRRADFNENWDKIDSGVGGIIDELESHKNDTNNPHQVTWEQTGSAPLSHTHTGDEITSAVTSAINADTAITAINADTVDGKHATSTANNLLVLDSAGRVPIANLPTGHNNGLDSDTVDGKHANSTAGNLPVLDSNGFVPITNLPIGHGGGLDADTIDGRHFEDIKKYEFVEQGVCKSGVEVSCRYSDYKVALIPLVSKYPENVPYLPPPQLTLSGGIFSQKNTYILVQGVTSEGKRGDVGIASLANRSPSTDYPITVSWSALAGASKYRVYAFLGETLQYPEYPVNFVQETTSTSIDLTSIPNSPETIHIDYDAPQSLRLEYIQTQNGFIPYLENYRLSSAQSISIGVNKGIGETYLFGTSPNETNSLAVKFRMVFTLNWPGFSGECTWGVRCRFRWRKSGQTDWLGTKTFEHSETWGSQWIGGSKAYSLNYVLSLSNLEEGVYEIELYDISQWANNGNFWFNSALRVYLDSLSYQMREKVGEYWGVYLIYAK